MGKKKGRNASTSGRHKELVLSQSLSLMKFDNVGRRSDKTPGPMEYIEQPKVPHPWKKDGFGYQDFLVMSKSGRLVLIQSKNQDVNGTADEKIPAQFFFADYAAESVRFDEFWVVLQGKWWFTNLGNKRINGYKKIAAMVNFKSDFKICVMPTPSPLFETKIKGLAE